MVSDRLVGQVPLQPVDHDRPPSRATRPIVRELARGVQEDRPRQRGTHVQDTRFRGQQGWQHRIGGGIIGALSVDHGSRLGAVGWSFHEAVDAFVVSNLVIGMSFGLCGALVAWYRPRHPVGWLYLVGGHVSR